MKLGFYVKQEGDCYSHALIANTDIYMIDYGNIPCYSYAL